MHDSSSCVRGSWSTHTHTHTTAASSRYLRGCFCSFSSSCCFCRMRCCRPRALLMHFCILPWALALLSCKVCLSLATTQTKQNKTKIGKRKMKQMQKIKSRVMGSMQTHYGGTEMKRILMFDWLGHTNRVDGEPNKILTQMLNSLKHKMIKL